MSAAPTRALAGNEPAIACDTLFDPSAYFDRWLADVNATLNQLAIEPPLIDVDQEREIYVESRIGSNCEVNFEGVMHFDGYSLGNVTSPNGTLVLSKRGRIEADIDVSTAIIDGAVTGNIKASERVVLESDARVTGQIFTRSITMRLGAILDGDCLLVTPETQVAAGVQFALDDPIGLPLDNESAVVLAEDTAEELEALLLSA